MSLVTRLSKTTKAISENITSTPATHFSKNLISSYNRNGQKTRQYSSNPNPKKADIADELLDEIKQKHEDDLIKQASNIQGIQNGLDGQLPFPEINSPSPEGVQGDDCVQYKIWLETCYKSGCQNGPQEYKNVKVPRKSLQDIFIEQERDIQEAANVYAKKRRKHISPAAPTQHPDDTS